MDSLWQSKTGKLFIGGCGTQLGLLLTFGGLATVLLACIFCASSGALSLSLAQPQAAQFPATDSSATPTPAVEMVQLRQEVNLLLGRVQYLRENVPTIAPPTLTPTPIPPTPLVTAGQAAVNLRSGPGVNYSRIGRLSLGESLPIVGRNSNATWWLVATPGGGVAWISAMVVAASYADDTIPVVSIPALLVQPAAQSIQPAAGSAPPVGAPQASYPVVLPETGPDIPPPAPPRGTPTAVAGQSRRFVQDTLGYKQLIRRMLLPTVSESFSPHGDQIAITERISLYTITPDGVTKRILLEDDETIDLVGGAIWSPDGRYLAFVANRVNDCDPCRTVGLVRLSDGAISYLAAPPDAGLDLPRWTQDGRLLAVAFSDELSEGNVYIYDLSGQGQPATGSYLLSSSHDGQKWFPWLPGITWDISRAAGVGSYYSD